MLANAHFVVDFVVAPLRHALAWILDCIVILVQHSAPPLPFTARFFLHVLNNAPHALPFASLTCLRFSAASLQVVALG